MTAQVTARFPGPLWAPAVALAVATWSMASGTAEAQATDAMPDHRQSDAEVAPAASAVPAPEADPAAVPPSEEPGAAPVPACDVLDVLADVDLARALRGPGSLSLGTTDDGYLVRGRALPDAGPGYRRIAAFADRDLGWATDELVGLIERVSAALTQDGPDDWPLRVGNLSRRHGGRMPYSVSHRSGRDADLAYPTRAASGAPADVDGYLAFDCRGHHFAHPDDRTWRYALDFGRTWQVVALLLADPAVEVEFVFVSACIRRRLLAEADRVGAPAWLRERALRVLHSPGRHAPHDDHFHVRVLCSADDLAAGCRNASRPWPWTRIHGSVLVAADGPVRRGLEDPRPDVRSRAYALLSTFAAPDLAHLLVGGLDDPEPSVREVAARALARAASPDVQPTLRARLLAARDAAGALRVLRALDAVLPEPSGPTAALLDAVARDPARALPDAVLTPEETQRVRHAAVRALAHAGTWRSVAALVAMLPQSDAELAAAIDDTLRHLTNAPSPAASDVAGLAAGWQRWFARHRGTSHDAWMRAGFRKAGFEVACPMGAWCAVPGLVAAVGGDRPTSYNAQRWLTRYAAGSAPALEPAAPDAAVDAWRAWLAGGLPRGARRRLQPR